MVGGDALRAGLQHTTQRPFRVVPFFDPGIWGGQWMKQKFDLDPSAPNYAWCFDCVPEENSLLLRYGAVRIEIPSQDLVLLHPRALLGEKVHARFGAEFPIRFDLLDTLGGQNLSFQVHPTTEYIQQHFGMHYTQMRVITSLRQSQGLRCIWGPERVPGPKRCWTTSDGPAAVKSRSTTPASSIILRRTSTIIF